MKAASRAEQENGLFQILLAYLLSLKPDKLTSTSDNAWRCHLTR